MTRNNMAKNYNIEDLRRDTKGMKVLTSTLNYDFSQALVEVFGEINAVKWFYGLPNEHLDSKTPYEVIRDEDEGRRIVSEFLEDILTGAPS